MTFAERFPGVPMYRDGLPTEELRAYVDAHLAAASMAKDEAPTSEVPKSVPADITWEVPWAVDFPPMIETEKEKKENNERH